MRTTFIVTYDISDDKRLRRVFKKMKGFGDAIQYSVFRCELNSMERLQMEIALEELIHDDEDQVLIFPLGPPGGKNERGIKALGKPWVDKDQRVVVV